MFTKFTGAQCYVMCAAVLIGREPANPPPPLPRIWAPIRRALFGLVTPSGDLVTTIG
jgi:hypothetical protein